MAVNNIISIKIDLTQVNVEGLIYRWDYRVFVVKSQEAKPITLTLV